MYYKLAHRTIIEQKKPNETNQIIIIYLVKTYTFV